MTSPPTPSYRLWGRTVLPAALVVVQATAPPPEVGPGELFEYWPTVIRVGWFLAGVLAVVILNRIFIQPVFTRILRKRNRNNPTLQNALHRYFQVVVILVAVFVGVSIAGYGPTLGNSALLISAVALAIGVAAQSVIGSLVSGIALVLDPDFNVGDYIQWPNGEGVVQSIALRTTRVKTRDGGLVTIPNTILTSNEISRPFGRGNHRVVQQFAIGYENEIDDAIRHLEDIAASIDAVLSDPAPVVYVDELGDVVTVRVHYWIRDPGQQDILAVQSKYARRIKRRFETEGLTISPAPELDISGQIAIDEPGRFRHSNADTDSDSGTNGEDR
ncbi:mechanosensitive ion channel family protein [Halorubrum sp. DTA46]|uniref:mechanosensitive ion channel family protein n=1 Tax=Halorubrum sp. DTA46 TaxID=3402162 RepID=UPI003AAA93EB